MQLTPNFNIVEFQCKDGSPVPLKYLGNVTKLAKNLQVLRDYLGEPIRLNSGYRSPVYNARIGGAKNSQHLLAKAADITVKSKSPKQLAVVIERLIAQGKMSQGGIGVYPGFVHYDCRKTKARW